MRTAHSGRNLPAGVCFLLGCLCLMGCHALRPQTGRSLPKSEAVAPVANAAFGKDAPASTSHVPGTTARVSGVASMEDGFEALDRKSVV